MNIYDVIIVGGGPAGLSAALVLGRCRRSVLIFDTGKQRNRMSKKMNAFLSRDGILPQEFLQAGREEIKRYGMSIITYEIEDVVKTDEGNFVATDSLGRKYCCRKILLATGIQDELPPIEGINEFYGISVHHCPYCDGWEERDKAIAVYGKGAKGYGLALAMKTWSQSVALYTDGKAYLTGRQKEELNRHHIAVYTQRIVKLSGTAGKLAAIVLADGASIPQQAMFFNTGYRQSCNIAEKLKCKFNRKKEAWINKFHESSVKGLYISGDAAHEMKLSIIAAAESAKAAVGINMALTEEDLTG